MTGRRAFVAGVAALGATTAVRAQSATGPRIGWLAYASPGEALPAFLEGMREQGYTGVNEPRIEVRVVPPDAERVRAAVEELRALPVVLIIAQAGVGPIAHRVIAGRVPMVFAFSGDPVVGGMVESLGRPGGSSTGMSFLALELVGKRLEIMQEILPALRRVAILANPQHPGEKAELKASLDAAQRLNLQAAYVEIVPGETTDAAFERIRQERVQGIVVFQDAGMVARAAAIAEFAQKERLLAISGWSQFAQAGFIATYGPSLRDAYRHLPVYVSRILKGARPADLPVEIPARIELVVNLRTAKALGVTVPQSLLLRADEVIN